MEWSKAILVVVTVLALAGTVCADMVQVPEASAHRPVAAAATLDRSDPESVAASDVSACLPIVDLGCVSAGLLAEVQTDAGDASESQPVCILSDGQDSLVLCLYALLSLGLCKSAPWVKKLSFGVVPGWYHDGGPFQIGHSYAASSDCLNSALVCFVQPDGVVRDRLPQYRRETMISLWRKSQFTPLVLASRGPPDPSSNLLYA
jgi:hypothetical protein